MSEILGALFKYLLGALGIGAVVAVLYSTLGSSKVSDAIAGQTQLQSSVQAAFATSPSGFTNVTTARVISGSLAPEKMVVGGNLQNAWNGAVTVAVDSTNAAQFVVTHAGVPAADCAKLSASQNNAVKITVNGTAIGVPVDAGLAISACSAASNTIAFTYAR